MSNPPLPSPDDAVTRPTGAAARLHRALMPDYNRRAAVYWWLTVMAGAGVLAVVLRQVLALPAAELSVVLAGVAMAMLAAFFPVRIARWKNSFTAGEIFIFLLLLLHGPAAATLAAAAESLLGSWRTSKRWTSRLASPAMASLSMFGIGSALHAGLQAAGGARRGQRGLDPAGHDGGRRRCTSSSTRVLITAVCHLKRGIWPRPGELFGNFGWIGITYAASASVACLLYLSTQQSGIGVLMAAAPIIVLMLLTLHSYFRAGRRPTKPHA